MLCKNIAKFYVKIGHLYAAILATVNPIYSYKPKEGSPEKNIIKKKSSKQKNVREARRKS